MAEGSAIAVGDWVWAAFPVMALKRRPGVLVARVGKAFAAVVPATAESGYSPDALEVSEPPAPRLSSCRLIAPQMCLLRFDRLSPLGARLPDEMRAALAAALRDRFGADWIERATRIQRAPARLRPQSSKARRRARRSKNSAPMIRG